MLGARHPVVSDIPTGRGFRKTDIRLCTVISPDPWGCPGRGRFAEQLSKEKYIGSRPGIVGYRKVCAPGALTQGRPEG